MRADQKRTVPPHAFPSEKELWEDSGDDTERLVFFSDAVFAIAMTLLIIDVKVPEANNPQELWRNLALLAPNLISFAISFFVIGTYWRVHHRLFRYIERYDQTLISLNALLLFLIVLQPFTTALISEYGNWQLPVVLYDGGLVLIGIVNTAIWVHATKNRKLVDPNLDPEIIRHHTVRSIYMILAFIVIILLTFFVYPGYAQLGLLLLIPIRRLERYLERRRRLSRTRTRTKRV